MIPSPIVNFKYHNLELELLSPKIDSRLFVVIMALAGYTRFALNKSIIITEIFRTQTMQDYYYKNNLKYKKKNWKSTHQFWRAADFSLKYFTNDEVKMVDEFLDKNFVYTSKRGIETSLVHNAGYGYHLHLQVDGDNFTSIKKQT